MGKKKPRCVSRAGRNQLDDKKRGWGKESCGQCIKSMGEVTSACHGHLISASVENSGFCPQPNDLQFLINTDIRLTGRTPNMG